MERFFMDLHKIVIILVPEILFVYVTRQVELGLIWHDQNIQTPFIFSPPPPTRSVYRISKEKFYPILSICGLHDFCMDETSSHHAESFEGACLTSVRWLCAAFPGALALLHCSCHSFCGVWTEHTWPRKGLFTTLPWIVKSSALFEMALHEGILPCLRTSNTPNIFPCTH